METVESNSGLDMKVEMLDWSSIVVKEEELALSPWAEESQGSGDSSPITFKGEPDWDTLFHDLDLPKPDYGEFPNWLEQQTEVPTLEYAGGGVGLVGVDEGGKVMWEEGRVSGEPGFIMTPLFHQPNTLIHPQQHSPPQDMGVSPPTQEKLQNALLEFEMVLCNTLTPPESPNAEENILTLIQEFSPNELDELVAERVEEMSPDHVGCSSVDTGSNYGGCSPTSSIEGGSNSCYSVSSGDDPDWSPGEEVISEEYERRVSGVKRKGRGGRNGNTGEVEDRKLRKKEQNRDAATRYRMKKKKEAEGMAGEEKELKKINENLKARKLELSKELKYLKGLMRDVYRAKGLIK